MSAVKLSRDADKFLCVMYREYLTRREHGVPKSEAGEFEEGLWRAFPELKNSISSDMDETVHELNDTGLFKEDICGNASLTKDGVIYMENRFKNGIQELTAFISQFASTASILLS